MQIIRLPYDNPMHSRLLIFFATFAAHALLLILVIVRSLDVFRWSLDSWEYMAIMQAIRDGKWDFYMFIYRTPAYPLLLRTFQAIFNLQPPQMTTWLPFQVALTALTAVFCYHVIGRLFQDRKLALQSGLLIAVFPPNLSGETPILTEALFNFTLVLTLLFLLRWLSNRRWRNFIVCLLGLDAMVLTRPTAELFIVGVLVVILFYNWRLIGYGLLLLVGFLVPVAAWTAHNYASYGISTYSSAGPYAFLFYKAVSTETMVTGEAPNDIVWDYSRIIENRIGNPPRQDPKTFPAGNYDYLYVTNPARYQAMVDLAKEKLLQYNVLHLVKMPYQFFRQFFRYEALDPFISVPVGAVIGIATILFAGIGLTKWLKAKHPVWQYILILGTLAYFLGSPSAFDIAVIRYASNGSVFLVPMIILGIWQTFQFVVQRRSRANTAAQVTEN